jgi:hypothetical protein
MKRDPIQMEMEPCDTPMLTDVIADGVERIEIFGGYARVVYWHWRYHRGEWVKATLDVAIVRPIFSFTSPFETWCDRVVRVPEPETPVMSSPLN